jgi:DedD protein
MQRGLGGTTVEPARTERHDREMTIGPFLLMLIGCGLFGLCGLCFLFGYSVGHRNAETSTAVSVPPPIIAAAQSGSSVAKPTAGQSGAQAAVPASEPTSEAGSGDSPAQATTSTASTSAEPEARVVPAVQTSQQPSGSGTVQPALSSQAGSIMVQIAAVSHPEDADVLVGALRKRGYAVTSRRDPMDGLLHVQVGPFANRNDAFAMRQKLLNDGYNAILQQP